MQNLIGSEKQIAWANAIREQVASAMRTATEAAEQHIRDNKSHVSEENIQAVMVMVREYVAEIMSNTSAGWWIDNRGLTLGHDAPIDSPMAHNLGSHLLTLTRGDARYGERIFELLPRRRVQN